MAASYYPPAPTQNYVAPTNQFVQGRASNTSDPRKIAANQLEQVRGQGDVLQQNDATLGNQYLGNASGTQSYLSPIESGLASGNGGYNSSEQSQIQLSPQDKQNIVTGAGISSGVGTASAVGAAERAAAAGGGNPAALATYRARAAQTQGANAGDAMTGARVAAQQAGSQGAQTVGNARMNQQQQGLGYFGNLQGQQTQTGLAEQGLQHQAYGTETSGTGAATSAGLTASQTPSTFDKILGGVAGAASAFLADGTPGYLADGDSDGGQDAVLGEDGPEAIVQAASNPVRSDTTFMADGDVSGDIGDGLPMSSGAYGATAAAGQMGPVKSPSWWQSVVSKANSGQQQPGGQPAAPQQWNKTTPYQQAGQAVGKIAGAFLADGDAGDAMMADGGFPADGPGLPKPPQIITSPTRVRLDKGDEVVPLSYRPNAKVRPSMAIAAMAPRMRHFGAARA